MAPSRLSIITVTHNRRELLLQKLRALAAQTLSPEHFELVVGVNGDADGTLEALQEASAPYRMTVLSFEVPLSVAAARNACAAAATGAVLYLSDDDCSPHPETLAAHLAAQAAPCVAVGGLEFVHSGQVETWRPKRVSFWNLNGANVSLPAAAFRAVGGFDERLEGYGGEDVLLGYALHRYGLPFRALPEARAQHLGPNPVRGGNLHKARSAGRNAARIARQHPELAYRLGVHPALLALKGVALRPGALWRALAPERYAYERAYLEGALSERDPASERGTL
ncbi:glycosyltransferase family 2 protein [Truepera radiovictrix]|uniref:glycosyltransferase family 2 protein n=1 Tax=Truepera radiovictrix TaxID=332249 RepID=UPI00030A523C|nr:glycosyltransferase [Truepera radiovictrix]WMT58457.1 glycosyltransferase [Truepera radiovictrix]